MILITGGEKSGKSYFAVNLALKMGEKRAFIATAQAIDDEMRDRIEKHKKERGKLFETFEEPLNISYVLETTKTYDVCIIDCMTTWLGNLFYFKCDLISMIDDFIDKLCGNEIIVTNEVGMGVIPREKQARYYVEILGNLNSKLAKLSDEVYMMISGIDMKIK